MMLALVYEPGVVDDPTALADSLGITQTVEGVPPRYADSFALNESGYAVVRETWKGFDILNGPVTVQQIAGLPDPGIDPAIAASTQRAAMRYAIMASSSYIDPAVISSAIARLDSIIASGSVPALVSSPTNADVVAQVRLLTTAINLVIDAVKDEARIEKGIINYLA